MIRILTLSLVYFFFTACHSNHETTSPEINKKEIEKEVKQVLNDYLDDIRSEGFMAELKYLDSSEDFFWTPPGYSHAINYDSVVKVLKLNAPRFKKVDNHFEKLKLVVLSEELVSFTGTITSEVTDTAGNVMKYSLVETGIWRKRKNGWKLINGQTGVVVR